jgi:hypothetical protein
MIRDTGLAWQAHGTLNAAGGNVIVYPCSYTASHEGPVVAEMSRREYRRPDQRVRAR